MITGGWNYVIAAYGITWFILGTYAFSLWIRHRRLKKQEDR